MTHLAVFRMAMPITYSHCFCNTLLVMFVDQSQFSALCIYSLPLQVYTASHNPVDGACNDRILQTGTYTLGLGDVLNKLQIAAKTTLFSVHVHNTKFNCLIALIAHCDWSDKSKTIKTKLHRFQVHILKDLCTFMRRKTGHILSLAVNKKPSCR